MKIGQRVHELLKEKGLQQKALAEHLGTKPSTINGWKAQNTNPTAEYIIPISEFLSVSPEYLLTGTESIKTTSPMRDDEIKLLELYNQLDYEKQIELRGYIKGLIHGIGSIETASERKSG